MSQFADRIRETTTTTGTGTVNLAGAVANYRSFVAGIGTGKAVIYTIAHRSAAEWEVGLGVITDATPDTLSRLTVLASSNSGSLVNFSAGVKDVVCSWTAFSAVSTQQLARKCVVATTANITLSGEQTLDGVLTSGSRVLVKSQSTASQNGIYVSAAGAWARAVDCYTGDGVGGQLVIVERGTANADTMWLCTNNSGSDVVGTDALSYAQIGGAALDATLVALAAFDTNGLMVQTATDTFTGRTLTGTADRVVITNGNGVGGNPTADIGSKVLTDDSTHTLTNKTFNANGTGNSLANVETADFAANVIDTDATLAANSAVRLATQSAVKQYVDSAISGLKWKRSVRAASTANVTLATAVENGDTIDGVVLATGDRVLLKDQSAAAENGIYVVAASGAPARATDADTSAELVSATVMVEEGTANADTQWTCTTNAPIVVGTDAINWTAITAGVSIGDGSVTTAKLADDAVTNAKLAPMDNARVKGRKTGGSGDPEDCTLSEVLDFIGSAAQGDILYRGAAGWSRLAAGATAGMLLTTGGAAANPSWEEIPDKAITNAKLADMAQATIKGRASGAGTGVPGDLTGAQVRAVIGYPARTVISFASGSPSLDWTLNDKFQLTLTGAATLSFANVVTDKLVLLRVVQDGTGSRTMNWPAGITWETGDGLAPTLSTSANAGDTFGFWALGGGLFRGYIVGLQEVA